MSTAYTMKWRHSIPSDAKAEPCPFCGAEQGVIMVLSPYENHGPYWVECGRCYAQGSETNPDTLAGVAQAIALWNIRAAARPGSAERDLAIARAVIEWLERPAHRMNVGDVRAIIAQVDASLSGVSGIDEAGESIGQSSEPATPSADATPPAQAAEPPSYPTIRMDDPRFKEWAKELGPAIVTAQEARANALEEAAQIVDEKAAWLSKQMLDSYPEQYLEDVAAEIRAAK